VVFGEVLVMSNLCMGKRLPSKRCSQWRQWKRNVMTTQSRQWALCAMGRISPQCPSCVWGIWFNYLFFNLFLMMEENFLSGPNLCSLPKSHWLCFLDAVDFGIGHVCFHSLASGTFRAKSLGVSVIHTFWALLLSSYVVRLVCVDHGPLFLFCVWWWW
jgi:hypothetical protein